MGKKIFWLNLLTVWSDGRNKGWRRMLTSTSLMNPSVITFWRYSYLVASSWLSWVVMGMRMKPSFRRHTNAPTKGGNTHLDALRMMNNTAGSDLWRLCESISASQSKAQRQRELPSLWVFRHIPLTLCLAAPYLTVKACPHIQGPGVQPDREMSNSTGSKTVLSVATSLTVSVGKG